jgi:hypothetical protein
MKGEAWNWLNASMRLARFHAPDPLAKTTATEAGAVPASVAVSRGLLLWRRGGLSS